MESFFHGKSSGLDPMVSFLAKPVLTSKETRILPEEVWVGCPMRDRLFLWNSESTRQTAPLVRGFTEDLQDPVFHQRIKGELIPATEGAIQAMMAKDEENFIESWKKISALQFEMFEKMIPQTLRPVWKKGLEKGHYYFKLCGAGGGGFFLVYVPVGASTVIRDPGKLKPLLAPSG
jgi:mevalonate kinase